MAFKSNSDAFIKQEAERLSQATRLAGASILARATVLAPKDTGALSEDGRVLKRAKLKTSVVFGRKSVPYARIQELGGVTGRGYKTKIKARNYLQKAGESVAKEGLGKYYKMAGGQK